MINITPNLKYFLKDTLIREYLKESDWERIYCAALNELTDDEEYVTLITMLNNTFGDTFKAPIGDFDIVLTTNDIINDSIDELIEDYFNNYYGFKNSKILKLKTPISNKEIASILAKDSKLNSYLLDDTLSERDNSFAQFKHNNLKFYVDYYDGDYSLRLQITFGDSDEFSEAPLYIDESSYRFIGETILLLNKKEIDKQIDHYINLFKAYI